MAPKRDKKMRKSSSTLKVGGTELEPLPASIPTTSKDAPPPLVDPEKKLSIPSRLSRFLYDRNQKTYCDRTCASWGKIIGYSIMYLIFLITYTLIFLFAALSIVKATTDFQVGGKIELLTYPDNGIGLTATPTGQDSGYPLIWYTEGELAQMQKYIDGIDKLLTSRKSDDSSRLGPCGRFPYGYGNEPCVIISINKRINWAGKPLEANASEAANAPKDVKEWMRSDKQMLWLHCHGYHAYDKEHIRRINYYPYPPGFDSKLFPMDVKNDYPLVAVQFSDFTREISLAVECKLWYNRKSSSVHFLLFVLPAERNKNHSRT